MTLEEEMFVEVGFGGATGDDTLATITIASLV